MADPYYLAVVTGLFVLAGTIIGGYINHLGQRAAEDRRVKKEAEERLKRRRREALEVAMEWVEPIEEAARKAILLRGALLRGEIDEEDFAQRFPQILGSLPNSLFKHRIFLDDAYDKSVGLINALDEFQYETTEEVDRRGRPLAHPRIDREFKAMDLLQARLKDFIDYLRDEYKRTFE